MPSPSQRRSASAPATLRLLPALVLVLAAGCSGGSPSSPPPPAPVLQVGGEWLGVEEVLGAEPVGNCYADWFNSIAGTLSDYRLVIVQNGASVRLTSTLLMRQIARSVETNEAGWGRRASAEELDEIDRS